MKALKALALFASFCVVPLAEARSQVLKDFGSFHVAGRPVSLSGLPTKDVVFTAGSAPIKSRSTPTATSRSSRCTCST